MVREDGKRNFALRDENGDENHVFSGNTPRQAALKAARRVAPVEDSEAAARADAVEVTLREKGTDKVHIYDAFAWEEAAGDDAPDWLGDTVTEANVSKQGTDHLDN